MCQAWCICFVITASFSGLRSDLFCAACSVTHFRNVLLLVVGDLLAVCGLKDVF